MGLSWHRRALEAFRPLLRLFADTAGNTLAMAAAAMIPLAGLIGGGIDMSRAYMAQSRLQVACDAAALAGRRVMTGGTVDTTVQNEALKFFRFNFPTGENSTTPPFGVASFTPSVTGGDNMTVVVQANTTVPTTVMSMFGYTSIPIKVDCNARLDFRNTDIVLVLDTTGSMLCATTEASCSNTTEKTTSKIKGLRSAVLALYDTLASAQTTLESQGLRLRYGIVPYSAGINVGAAIRSVDSNYFRATAPFQSREAKFENPHYVDTVGTTGTPYWQVYSGGSISQSNCLKFMKNQSPYNTATTNGATPPTTLITYSFPQDGAATDGGTNGEWGWTGAPDTSGNTKSCRRLVAETPTTYSQNGWEFSGWVYRQSTFNVSNFRTGNTITLISDTNGWVAQAYGGDASDPAHVHNEQEVAQLQADGNASGFGTTTSSWGGCIEERSTVSTIISTSPLTVPANAYDLNIDYIPNSDATRWVTQFEDVSYRRNSASSGNPTADASSGTGSTAYCPQAAKRLQAWTRSDLNTYLNSLFAKGNTYHDFGMIWGARFISPTGIFSGDNPTTYNNSGVDRYIVFMTDGVLNTDENNYGAYGIEYLDKRVTGGFTTSADQDSRHNRRFQIACNEAKARVNALWVIGFAQALTTELTQCASSSDKASTIADSAGLIAKFQQIGKEIGALRLTK